VTAEASTPPAPDRPAFSLAVALVTHQLNDDERLLLANLCRSLAGLVPEIATRLE
jgi:hypothetical protein